MSKKKFGQHFLNNISVVKKIANFAQIKDKVVIEIGAGKGMLTREIARQAKIVYATEIDPFYAALLARKNIPNVVVINTDFLTFDLADYKDSVIIGNIPYYLTTKIIEKLVHERNKFLYAVLTLQKEYGERLLAKPDTPQYCSITCFVNYYFNVVKGFNISPKSFTPLPRVYSMVICLNHIEPPFSLKDEQNFFNFINGIFRYRRKILKNSLFNYLGFLPDFGDIKILSKRPEQLKLIEFFQIYKRMNADHIFL